MTPERWRRVLELFGEAVELPAEKREAFLAAECSDDEALASEVRRMVEADARPNPLVDSPLVEGLLTSPTEEFEPSLAGRTVAGYELTQRLGAGGMGEVYLARDAKLRRRVAVKLLRERFTRDPDRMARFEREAYAASSLSHPCVLHVYEFGEHEGRRYIVTEYVEGLTLRQRIAAGVKLSEALRIATQMAEGVEAAHGAGVVHRDIKPENVIVRPDGYVKILDFGIAKLTELRMGIADCGLMKAMLPPIRNPQSPIRNRRRRASSSARPSTCRRSRRVGREWTRGRTCGASASSSTRC